MKNWTLALTLGTFCINAIIGVKSIAGPPPGIDIALGLISDYAKAELAAGACRALANGGVGSNSVDNDTVSNFTNFFGETEINLDCYHSNELAFAFAQISWQIPSNGKDSLFLQKVYNAITFPPEESGQKNPQTAYADWQISYRGQIVHGVGAPPTNVDNPRISESRVRSLLEPPQQNSFNSSSSSDEFIINLPDYITLDTILYAPNWSYWTPLFIDGSETPDAAWDYVIYTLQSLNIDYLETEISATGEDSKYDESFKDDDDDNMEIPEPSPILGLLALGTLGAASTLKRKLKPSQSTEKETTKVS